MPLTPNVPRRPKRISAVPPHRGDGADYSLYLIGSGEGCSYASGESLLIEGVLYGEERLVLVIKLKPLDGESLSIVLGVVEAADRVTRDLALRIEVGELRVDLFTEDTEAGLMDGGGADNLLILV